MSPKANWLKTFLFSIILFFLSYTIFLISWIKIAPVYGTFIVKTASFVTALFTNVEVKKIEKSGEKHTVYFSFRKPIPMRGLVQLDLDLSLSASKYTYNVPLTFALAIALLPIVSWKKKNLIEIGAILVVIHIMYVVFFEGLHLYYALVKAGLKQPSIKVQAFWEYFWAFTQSMVIRFEPFLIALYLFLRNVKFKAPAQ